MQDFVPLEAGGIFHGRYRIIRRIKAGGMGAVYEVLDERTDKRRALKIMLPMALEDDDFRARFDREAKVTGNIESDHVVHVSDAGVDDATGTPFLVMELLRGEELARVVRKRGALPPAEALLYLSQAALGLDKTHAAGIVHRDLKPDNLFLTTADDGSPRLKILDFGIAKVLSPGGRANTTRALGTPKYMAPEQVRAEKTIGPRTDVYALGHIAYTVLVGEAYWAEEESEANDSLFMFLAKVVAGADESAVERAARRRQVTLPGGFDAWFFHATSVAPEHRFPSAGVAVAALAQALALPVVPALSAAAAALAASPPPAPAPTAPAPATAPAIASGPVDAARSATPSAKMLAPSAARADSGHTDGSWGGTMVGSPSPKSRALAIGAAALVALAGIGAAAYVLLLRAPETSAAGAATTTTAPPSASPGGPRAELTQDAPVEVSPAPSGTSSVSVSAAAAAARRTGSKPVAASTSAPTTSAAASKPGAAGVVDPWANKGAGPSPAPSPAPSPTPSPAPSAPPASTKPGMF